MNCVVAVARRGGVDIVLNEASARQTPAYVGFSQQDHSRKLGDAALDQVMGNYANTIHSLKRFIGKRFDDAQVQADIGWCPFNVVKMPDGGVGFEVSWNGETKAFTITQIVAMFLAKLKKVVELEVGSQVRDCVISC